MASRTRTPVRVRILVLPEVTPTAVYGLFEIFSAVGLSWPELTGQGEPAALFDVRIVSADGQPFASAIGTPIAPHGVIGDAGAADVIVVTDLALPADFDPRGAWPDLGAWLRRQYESGATICSVCTGSVLLAAAGLLDGLEATTHWSACDLFARGFPEVRLKPARILVPAGREHRIITSGGASSWEDLALYLIARFHGQQEAVRTAKIFLLGDRSEGQLPFAAMNAARNHSDAAIAQCQEWVAMHYADPGPVARMVERSGLTERTFKRRFKQATGYAPLDYVQTLRIEESKQILETTAEPVDAVARQVGYEDPTSFRRLFKRLTGVTPARYRQRFRFTAA